MGRRPESYMSKRTLKDKNPPRLKHLSKGARKRLLALERKQRTSTLSSSERLEYARLSGDASVSLHAFLRGDKPEPREPARKPTQPPDVPLTKLARAKGGWAILSGTERIFIADEAEANRVFRALDKQARALRRQALKKEASRNADELRYIAKERQEIAEERKRLKAVDASLDFRGNELRVRERLLRAEQERLQREGPKLASALAVTPGRAVASGPRKFAKKEHV